MDPNYALPESFSLEHVVTIRSLPSKAVQEHCCNPVLRGGTRGAGMVGLSRFGEDGAFEEGLAARQKGAACNLSVKQ